MACEVGKCAARCVQVTSGSACDSLHSCKPSWPTTQQCVYTASEVHSGQGYRRDNQIQGSFYESISLVEIIGHNQQWTGGRRLSQQMHNLLFRLSKHIWSSPAYPWVSVWSTLGLNRPAGRRHWLLGPELGLDWLVSSHQPPATSQHHTY